MNRQINSVFCSKCGKLIQQNEEYSICKSCSTLLCSHCLLYARSLSPIVKCPQCQNPIETNPKAPVINTAFLSSIKENPALFSNLTNLIDARVIQRDLVYVVGLPVKYANEDTLLKYEFFGQYGPIKKVVVNSSHVHSSSNQTLSVSAYVTFRNSEDALECIYSLESFTLEGSQMKASFGTTKYCSAFLKAQKCTNPDCMYLHAVGNPNDTFLKDDITGSSSKFIEMTRPLRPMDYDEYPKQDARPTILPPRRLMKKETSPKKILVGKRKNSSSILPFDFLLLDKNEYTGTEFNDYIEEEIVVDAQNPPISLSTQLRIRKTPLRRIYNSLLHSETH